MANDPARHKQQISTTALAVVAVAITIVSSVVAVTVSYTTTSVNLTNLQTRDLEHRESTKASIDELKVADRELRQEYIATQRANAQTHEKLTATTTRIETLLEVIAANEKTRRR